MGHHALFFKKTFSIRENAADFLQHTLAPELIEEMDFDTLTIEKKSHVDTALADNFSDTVYNCRFSGTRIKIALLIMKNIFDQQKLEHYLTHFLEIGRAYFQETQGLKFLHRDKIWFALVKKIYIICPIKF
jgi:hypothetical protein